MSNKPPERSEHPTPEWNPLEAVLWFQQYSSQKNNHCVFKCEFITNLSTENSFTRFATLFHSRWYCRSPDIPHLIWAKCVRLFCRHALFADWKRPAGGSSIHMRSGIGISKSIVRYHLRITLENFEGQINFLDCVIRGLVVFAEFFLHGNFFFTKNKKAVPPKNKNKRQFQVI